MEFKSGFILYLLFIISPLCILNINLRKLGKDSEVIITIIGNGNQQILSDYVFNNYQPTEIKINDNTINGIDKFAENLVNLENVVILKWNYLLTTCQEMFSKLSNIVKIDLSKFDSTKVTNMLSMFYECTSLTSINFDNFDTSLVTDMAYLFYKCYSLASLELSNFNTKSVEIMVSMFCECTSLKYLNLSSFDTSSVKKMYCMFLNNNSLESLYIDNFNTSSVIDMGSMFDGCSKLKSLNLTNFNTSSVTNMGGMFYECKLLKSLNLNNFDTSSVNTMPAMFYGCNSLTSLNLSNFNTSSVTIMSELFSQCYSLKLLDITNFNTSLLTDMSYLFDGCISLISLDLSNFNTLSTTDMYKMFYNCSSLTSLNLSNFETSSVTNMTEMFEGCNKELIYCINEENNGVNKILEHLTDNSFHNNNCSYLCFIQSKKYIFEKKKCYINCYDDNDYKYEYNNKCYISCPNGTKISSFGNHLCEVEVEYSNIISTSTNIVPILESSNIIKNSDIETNNVIDIETESDIKHNIYTSYYSDNYAHIDDTTTYSLNSVYQDMNYFRNLCHINDDSITKDDIIRKIRSEFNNGYLDSLINIFIKGRKEDLLANENDIIYQISSTYNQKNNKYTNISTIDLGKCEVKLRSYYNISNNTILLIFKVEIKEEGLLIPIIEYEIYNLETKEKLDWKICENIKIYAYIPVSIDENNLFKYNLTSEYYNDICFPYTTIDKTDIILKDRRDECIQKNLSLCEKDCEYQGYDFNTKNVLCECFIKIKFPLISEISINKDKLFNQFFDLKKTINISILKCYKVLFSKKGLIHNYGSYIILSIILIMIILVFIFRFKGYKLFIKKVNYLIKNIIDNTSKNNKITKKCTKNKIKKKDSKIKIKSEKIKKTENIKINKIQNNKIKIKKKNAPIKKSYKNKNIINNKKMKNDSNIYNSKSNIFINVKKKQNFHISIYNNINKNRKNKNILINQQNFMNYNDYELNNLSYQIALKIDKRTYVEYYVSLLKTKHLIIFSFYTDSDYNSKIIKISLLLFSFALLYTVNALFFTESTIHKIYEDKGDFDFIYQIPQVLYSSFISTTINTIIKLISLSEKNILQIKNEKKNIKEKASKVLKCLIIKFILFFILSFIFLIFFWYYLSCFCAVYENSQIHLFKDVLVSFCLNLLYPFGLNLIPGIFRISSLRDKNKKRKCLYNFSKIIQILI